MLSSLDFIISLGSPDHYAFCFPKMVSGSHAKLKRLIVAFASLASLYGLFSEVQMMDPAWHGRRLDASRGAAPQVVPSTGFAMCGRRTNQGPLSRHQQKKIGRCRKRFNKQVPTLVLEGYDSYGRTGNHLKALLNALQYTRDFKYQLAIMYNSWAMEVLLQYFMAGDGSAEWQARVERALCIKIFRDPRELKNWRIIPPQKIDAKALFYYRSHISQKDYIAYQSFTLRVLFRHINLGEGNDNHGVTVRDMCSAVDTLFGTDRSTVKYSVIHLRAFEGKPFVFRVANNSEFDVKGALMMSPDYVKSILHPLGQLQNPIVVITDGQNKIALERLQADADIGPMIRVIPEEASWIGGDMTLGILADTFIGSPMSTFSMFIAQARIALGLSDAYLYRARNDNQEWVTSCETRTCLYRNLINPGERTAKKKTRKCDEGCVRLLKRHEGVKNVRSLTHGTIKNVIAQLPKGGLDSFFRQVENS